MAPGSCDEAPTVALGEREQIRAVRARLDEEALDAARREDEQAPALAAARVDNAGGNVHGVAGTERPLLAGHHGLELTLQHVDRLGLVQVPMWRQRPAGGRAVLDQAERPARVLRAQMYLQPQPAGELELRGQRLGRG